MQSFQRLKSDFFSLAINVMWSNGDVNHRGHLEKQTGHSI